MADHSENSPPDAVGIMARAIEEEVCRPYEWTPEQFEMWWTKDSRNKNHDMRRRQASSALEALRAAGFSVEPPQPLPVKAP